ncbi:carbohydrate ABC transporter permease [Streptomyces sp. NPDC096310]|uniref:carbohydrate ABC transporter permease n=1 Tax=Streptomyces sp. NPDC096310 TaxID=3366082 RepID=UPI00380BF902
MDRYTSGASAAGPQETAGGPPSRRRNAYRLYPRWFYLPAAALYIPLFLIPTIISFFFSLTRWTLDDFTFIGLENFQTLFQDPTMRLGLVNTFVYAAVTTVLKVVLGLWIAMFLASRIRGSHIYRAIVFFPVIVSTLGVGFTFNALLQPNGVMNDALSLFGIAGPSWLGDPDTALLSVALVDVWKGLGFAAVIYIAGIVSIPSDVTEAARVDGAGRFQVFRHVTLPLLRPATSTVIILSVIGGLKSFEMVWSMTQGGPAGHSDVIASLIYKQYASGFYGLSTAGNVVLFVIVAAVALPLSYFLNRRETQL